MTKAVAFDLGGTLMEYKGMPLNWDEYYYRGFQNVNQLNELSLAEEDILNATKVLKEYNPRNCGREYEVAPEIIFEEATAGWKKKTSIGKIIDDFFSGMSLETCIFDYSAGIIKECKKKGLIVSCLTDLPNGMPDKMFRKSIITIDSLFDLYVSSQICGARKPNKKGLEYIADYFGIDVSDILFVGDEKKDENTALNAGCKFMYIEEYLNNF